MEIGLPARVIRIPNIRVYRDWNCYLGAILTDYASSAFYRWESLAGGTEKGSLRLCGGGVPDYPGSGED